MNNVRPALSRVIGGVMACNVLGGITVHAKAWLGKINYTTEEDRLVPRIMDGVRVSAQFIAVCRRLRMGSMGTKASKRLASLQAMSLATARRYATPPPDLTRYKL